MNINAATAFLDRDNTLHYKSQYESPTLPKFNKSLGENKLAAACACHVANGVN